LYRSRESHRLFDPSNTQSETQHRYFDGTLTNSLWLKSALVSSPIVRYTSHAVRSNRHPDMVSVPTSRPVSPAACTRTPTSRNPQLVNERPANWSNTIWWLRKSSFPLEYEPLNVQLTNVARASPLRSSRPLIVHKRPAGLRNRQLTNTMSSADFIWVSG
jgi:hypothetical protein